MRTDGDVYAMHGPPPNDSATVARTTTGDETNDSNSAPQSFRRKATPLAPGVRADFISKMARRRSRIGHGSGHCSPLITSGADTFGTVARAIDSNPSPSKTPKTTPIARMAASVAGRAMALDRPAAPSHRCPANVNCLRFLLLCLPETVGAARRCDRRRGGAAEVHVGMRQLHFAPLASLSHLDAGVEGSNAPRVVQR